MRIEFSGNQIFPEPIVLTFLSSKTFKPQQFIDMGYTNYEVMCIGGGGGSGGVVSTTYPGGGGGGGLHRVKGLLSALPSSTPIVVGAGGARGADGTTSTATNGGDGGASTFNGTLCQASGGKGGLHPTATGNTAIGANGGAGGQGNSSVAGGGAAGSVAGTGLTSGFQTGAAAADGTWDGSIGKGGGGGSGGQQGSGGPPGNPMPGPSGRGSYSTSDTLVYGPGESNQVPSTNVQQIGAGGGGGAKASPLNGLPTAYGTGRGLTACDAGAVVIRLTKV
jgi:hypothetical protein